MQPYDPLARLAHEISHQEAIAALEFCLRFLTASTLDDLTAVQLTAAQQLTAGSRLIDPLEHIYSTISEAVQQRLPVLEATLLWAQRQDPTTRIVDQSAASWSIELADHNQRRRVQATLAPHDEDDLNADTITLLVNGDTVTVHISDDGSLQL